MSHEQAIRALRDGIAALPEEGRDRFIESDRGAAMFAYEMHSTTDIKKKVALAMKAACLLREGLPPPRAPLSRWDPETP